MCPILLSTCTSLPTLITNGTDVPSPSSPGLLRVLFLPAGMLAEFYPEALTVTPHTLKFPY